MPADAKKSSTPPKKPSRGLPSTSERCQSSGLPSCPTCCLSHSHLSHLQFGPHFSQHCPPSCCCGHGIARHGRDTRKQNTRTIKALIYPPFRNAKLANSAACGRARSYPDRSVRATDPARGAALTHNSRYMRHHAPRPTCDKVDRFR